MDLYVKGLNLFTRSPQCSLGTIIKSEIQLWGTIGRMENNDKDRNREGAWNDDKGAR